MSSSTNFDSNYVQNKKTYNLRSFDQDKNFDIVYSYVRYPTCADLIQSPYLQFKGLNLEIDGDSKDQYIQNIYISYDLYCGQKPNQFQIFSAWKQNQQYTYVYKSQDLSSMEKDSCESFKISLFENMDLTILPQKFSSASINFNAYDSNNKMLYTQLSNLQVLFYYECPIGCKGSCPQRNCQDCQSGYNLKNGKCVLQCPQSQYAQQDQSSKQSCLPCISNCNECADGNTCITCANGFTYAFVNGQNMCHPSCSQSNQYIDTTGQCQNCMQYCSKCSQANKCDTCLSGFTLSDSFICQCQGFFNSNNQCIPCAPSCKTCSDSSITSCKSCINNYYAVIDYQNQSLFQCLQICPNNYQLINNTCKKCIQTIYNSCFNCPSTCRSCSPSQINKCQDCYPGMHLNSNSLCEPQPQPGLQIDSRNLNFYYCSYNNVAVVQASFSNSSPRLTLEFGINLVSIAGFNCNQIFDSVTLNLLGSSTCSINYSQIIVTLSQDANLMVNQIISITTTAQVLQFQGFSSKIDTIYLISYVQEPVTPQVNVLYNQIVNSCDDIQFQIQKPQNDAGRGFLSLQWILSNSQAFNQETLQNLNGIINSANTLQSLTILIPKYTLPINTSITIQLTYTLKVYQSNNLSFTTNNQLKKQIIISQVQNKYPPIFRYMDLQITYFFTIQQCDKQGIHYLQDLFDIQITSLALPSISKSLTQFDDQQIQLYIQPNLIPVSTNLDIKITVQTSSDTSISNTNTLSIPYTLSKLQILIQNGANMLVDYKINLTLIGFARDYEIQDPNSPQEIQLSWQCKSLQVQNGDNQCYTYQNKVYVPQNTQNITIDGGTFNPYQTLSFTLQGSKGSRTSQYSSLLVFTEIDLPPLLVIFDDPKQIQQININEDISATLIYGSNVPSDILTYAGAVLYNNYVVGVIKFDYYKVKFRIWDYFSNIKADNLIVQVRFTVYNPENIMPSLSVTNFNINLPPQKCVLSVTPSSGQALMTQFTIQFNGCTAINNPLTYQFFYYNQTSDLKQEIQIPQNILRRQLKDQNLESKITTNLPSGNIVIMGQAMDSYLAVFNTTIQVNVSPFQESEQKLLSLLDSAIQQKSTKVNQIIINLCVFGEEIAKDTPLFNLDSVNIKKSLLVQAIINQSNMLSSNSFLSTYANKIIAALQGSITTKYQTQSQSVLNQISTILQNSEQKIANQDKNNKLFNNNDIILQNLVDCFKILSSTTQSISQMLQQLSNNNGKRLLKSEDDYLKSIDALRALSSPSSQTLLQQQMDLSDQIGNLLNKITLPNQGELQLQELQGNLISINTDQITSKNLQKYMFIQNQPQQQDSNIFNVIMTSYSSNPFIQTDGFQQYITQLQNTTPDIQVSINPVVKPYIQNLNNASSQELNNSFTLQFQNIKPSKYNLTCLQQQSQSNWTQQDCKLIESSKTGSFTCLCKNQKPTTIAEDLQDLLDNKNLKTAFGSQGIQNISNFTTFYEYAVFWILSSVTLIQIGLCIYGNTLDSKNKIAFVGSMTKINPISLTNFDNFEQKITDDQYQIQLHQQKQESDKLQQKESTVFISYLPQKQQSQRGTQSNINLKRPDYDQQGSKLFVQQQENEIKYQKVQNIQSLSDNQSIQSIYLNSKDNKQEQKFDQQNNIIEQENVKKTNDIEDKNKQIIKNLECQGLQFFTQEQYIHQIYGFYESKQTTPGIQISINPVIKPSIQNINNTPSQGLNNSLTLQFSNIKPSKYNLTCLQQQSQSKWTQQDCKLVQSTNSGSYTCVCQNQKPTTITEDLQDLLDNKNLKTAFGSQGIENISNFTTFYEYAVFWILSSVTLILIGLCIYGNTIDSKNKIEFAGSMTKVNPTSLVNSDNFEQKITDEQYQMKLNQQKQESDKLQQKNSVVFINYLQQKQQTQRVTQSNINLKRPEDDYQGSKLFVQQQQSDINNQKVQNLQSLSDNQSIQSINLNSKDSKQQYKLDQQNNIIEQMNNKKTNNIEDYSKQNKEQQESIVDILQGSKNTQKLMKTSFLKKILIFHSFSSIFFVYSNQESRALRLTIFYIRIIHSLSISTIFDQQYNEEQILLVSLINSVILIASVTLIRFLNKSRKIFKTVAFLLMIGLLILYYYIILSIVSGQSENFSNKRISSFFIMFGVDFLILQTLVSIINIFAFVKIVQNAIQNKFILKLLSLLQIQDILENLTL
ncbi:REJ domain protein (macronuclear) [Tetrahymena thermophila SB210]|uniref:REJ domain protein n=1 Tax=Tetrahymena thermophila (strain SB210) TaxID=312017 RepID=W7X2A5_TETTS|nr:REJ domain protein [Tetrahymena thermophila SB210]EWS73335.1 REJ domain protein [Tetrahymena thermophila SB210]|eukprot:XP_012654140.1 REJ domain protein [Tetrahymena thermophila SB210]